MPYHVPALDTPETSISWPLDTDPTITWTLPAQTPDHIIIWTNSVADWASASELVTLGGSDTTYTDASATRDGTPFYYWVICYNAGGVGAGFNLGVLGCQNKQSVSGQTVNATLGGGSLTEPFAFTNDTTPLLGEFIADITFGWTGVSGSVAIINDVSAALSEQTVSTPHILAEAIAADGASGSGDSGTQTSTPNAFTQTSIEWLAIGFQYVGIGAATVTGVSSTAKLSYASPDTSNGGAGGGGGGVGANMRPGQITLGIAGSLPVPLPCIPCCQTDMPICNWSSRQPKPVFRRS